jgi:hypothetical protein
MKLLLVSAMCCTVMMGQAVRADDAPSARPNETNAQLMRRCMAEQKAKSATTAAAEMRKTCQAQIKTYKDHPSATSPTAAPAT